MKHIEQIQPEYAAFELDRIGREETDATASAALTALLHNVTGCAIPPTSDTPQSEVEELVPLCLSILRRHWQTPLTALGDGTTPMSLADLMRRLILGRVDGNEALGIPPANANIPTAVAALTKRHIDDGLTLTLTDGTIMPLPDGLSLAQLLCTGLADNITELQDSNNGWGAKDNSGTDLLNLFPNCETLTLGMVEIKGNGKYISGKSNLKGTVSFPHLKRYGQPTADQQNGIIYGCPNVTKLYMPELEYVNHYSRMAGSADWAMIGNMQGLEEIEFGNITTWTGSWTGSANFIIDCPKCGCLKFKGIHCSMNLTYWNPTTALSERLPEFLSNFKTYIAQRLTDKGSGKTLTLSQAVRDAIQQDPDIVNIITSKGWTISPAPSV